MQCAEQVLYAVRLAAGDGLATGAQADPDGFARLDPSIPARDAAAKVVETASSRDAHGGEIPHSCSISSGANTAASAKTTNYARLSEGYDIEIMGKMAETKPAIQCVQ